MGVSGNGRGGILLCHRKKGGHSMFDSIPKLTACILKEQAHISCNLVIATPTRVKLIRSIGLSP